MNELLENIKTSFKTQFKAIRIDSEAAGMLDKLDVLINSIESIITTGTNTVDRLVNGYLSMDPINEI